MRKVKANKFRNGSNTHTHTLSRLSLPRRPRTFYTRCFCLCKLET